MKKPSKIHIFLLLAILFSLTTFCNDPNQGTIPYAYVNISIDLQDPEYINLQNVGGTEMITGGYNNNGIVVYRSGIDEFKAYDRTCPYNIEDDCRVYIDSTSQVLVKCPCCGSKYELVYGSVVQTPAKVPLKEYNTSFNGDYLRIYN